MSFFHRIKSIVLFLHPNRWHAGTINLIRGSPEAKVRRVRSVSPLPVRLAGYHWVEMFDGAVPAARKDTRYQVRSDVAGTRAFSPFWWLYVTPSSISFSGNMPARPGNCSPIPAERSGPATCTGTQCGERCLITTGARR